jgi:hypothetical protein
LAAQEIGRFAPDLAVLSRQQRKHGLVRAKPTQLNDCFGDMNCVTTTYWLHVRENAASAKQENRMAEKSALETFG